MVGSAIVRALQKQGETRAFILATQTYRLKVRRLNEFIFLLFTQLLDQVNI